MVNVVPLLYDSKCDIFRKIEEKNKHGTTILKDFLLFKDISCRVSYKKKSASVNVEKHYNSTQTIILFINPNIDIPTGSTVIVTNNGAEKEYSYSGESARYSGHQEIILIMSERV